MLPEHLLPHIVIVQTPGTTTDDYGNTVQDWDSPAEVSVAARIELVLGLAVEARETTNGRDATVSTWRIFTNHPISLFQRILWGARTFDVDGDVSPVYAQTGPHHYEAILKAR